MVIENNINPEQARQQLIAAFPAKVARKRAKAIVINNTAGAVPEIAANTRTTPGIIYHARLHLRRLQRGDHGPDSRHVSEHGTHRLGFYSWLTRRNQTDSGVMTTI